MTKRQIEVTEKMKGFYSQFGEFEMTELKSGCIRIKYFDMTEKEANETGERRIHFIDIIDKKGIAILGDDAYNTI